MQYFNREVRRNSVQLKFKFKKKIIIQALCTAQRVLTPLDIKLRFKHLIL